MAPVSTDERRRLLDRVTRLANDDLHTLWTRAADAEDFAKTITDTYPGLVDSYAEVAGHLAATWFEDAAPGSDYQAKVAQLPPEEQLRNSAEWALGAPGEEGLTRLEGSLQRAVYDGARETTLLNVRETGGHWAREAEPDACDFCQGLEGEYGSDEAARFEAHDHCQCMAVEVRTDETTTEVPPSREVLDQQAYDAVKQSGGVTIDLAGHSPTDGYAYAPYKGTELIVPEDEFTPKHIDNFIDAHADELAQPGNNLGMWTQDGNVYLDISRVGPPTAETLATAQDAQQLAVYDLGNGKEINLGTIDSTGQYRSLGEATDLHNQYREEIARGNEAASPPGVGEIPASQAEVARPPAPGPTTWEDRPTLKERREAIEDRIPEMKNNRLQRFSEIPEETLTEGRRWYADQMTTVANLSLDTDYTPLQAVGVNVSTSVRTGYGPNLAFTDQYLHAPPGQGEAVIREAGAMGANAERATRAADDTSYGQLLATLKEKSESEKLSNYLPSIWSKAHPDDTGPGPFFTVDTWDSRIADHSPNEIRAILGVEPGTRLTDTQEALGERLLNEDKYGTHWTWSAKREQWVEKPNYVAGNKVGDNYEAIKRSGVEAAAEAKPFPGTYESQFNPDTGRWETVKTSDEPTPWKPEDFQAALWIHARNGSAH